VGLGRLPVLCVLGMILFPSATGWASTVSVDGDFVRYVAASGESNDLVITRTGADFRYSDAGASITAGAGCVMDGADALCPGDGFFVYVDLDDGDDSADLLENVWGRALGGAGDDIVNGFGSVEGGPGDDRLSGSYLLGGEGDDQFLLAAGPPAFEVTAYGGPGNDTMQGHVGGDSFYPGLGDDNIDGGGGFDVINAWDGGPNLRLTPTALFGEGSDTLRSIEAATLAVDGPGRAVYNARAWRRRLVIWADSGNDLIVGGSGPDLIYAGAGNDVIHGRAGRDEIRAEEGADVLFSRDRQWDIVDGGPGRDRARVDGFDHRRRIETYFN
jgi:Ca2+-binding RTX toxin-like protein